MAESISKGKEKVAFLHGTEGRERKEQRKEQRKEENGNKPKRTQDTNSENPRVVPVQGVSNQGWELITQPKNRVGVDWLESSVLTDELVRGRCGGDTRRRYRGD